MRTNPKTIRLAKIRRYIREAIKWHKVDKGMPEFYSTENYKTSRRKKYPVKGDFPYYIKSDRAIRDIAEKIYDLFDVKIVRFRGKYTICECRCGCTNEIPSYNVTGLCLHCYRDHRALNKEEK